MSQEELKMKPLTDEERASAKERGHTGEKHSHPSYGKISASRFNGGNTSYFGSKILHNGGVSIKISTAYLSRHDGYEFFHDNSNIIEVNLTAQQWVDFISQMNTTGVPCTLQYVPKSVKEDIVNDERVALERLPNPPEPEHFKVTVEEVDILIRSTLDDIERLRGYIKDCKANKGEKEILMGALRSLESKLHNSYEFRKEMFRKDIEKAVGEGKREIESYISMNRGSGLKEIGFVEYEGIGESNE